MNHKILLALLTLSSLQLNQAFAQETGSLLAIANEETSPLIQAKENDMAEFGNKAPWFVKKYQVQGGLFIPFNNTNIRVQGNAAKIGTDIDFEKDLGYNDYSFSGFAGFQWHISRRSKLSLSYFYLGRSSSHTLEKTIEFADETYPINANTNSFFNTHIARVYYGYSIFSKPKYEAGLMIGTHILKTNIGMALNTSVGSVAYSSNFDFTAPLPDVGVYGGYAITDKWAVNAEVCYLSIAISNIDGRILSYNLSVQYNPLPYLGFSASYTGLDFNLDVDGDRLDGFIKWGYNGPSLTATYTFGRGF